MKKHGIIYIAYIAFLMAGVVLAGCAKHQQKENGVPEIDVAEAFTDSVVLYKTYPGVLTAGTTAQVVAQVNGRLLSSPVRPGSYVRKGEVLFTIDPTVYRNAVTRAESQLSTARSQYEYYTKQHAALNKALEADAVSKMEVLQAKSNMDQALASIRDAEAALSTARVNLSHCTITAPISEYISSGAPDVGNYISGEASPQVFCTIYDNAKVKANFYLSDTQYEDLVAANGGIDAAIYRNVPVEFKEKMKHDYTTDLYFISPTVSQSTGTMLMKGDIVNVDNELKDGMYATISLPYGSNPKAILVKDASIGSDQLGKYLYTVNDSNKIVYTPIEIGDLYRDSLRVVTSGIGPGQRYVTKALLTVRRGETIKPKMTK